MFNHSTKVNMQTWRFYWDRNFFISWHGEVTDVVGTECEDEDEERVEGDDPANVLKEHQSSVQTLKCDF